MGMAQHGSYIHVNQKDKNDPIKKAMVQIIPHRSHLQLYQTVVLPKV